MSTKKFYSDVEVKSDIILSNETPNTVLATDANGKLKSTPVTSTELGYLSGTTSSIQTQINNESSARASADAALQTELDALEAEVAALPDPIYYAGTYDASTNSPTLSNTDIGAQGKLYRVTVAGSVDFGAGVITFNVGDKVVNNGTNWEKWDVSDEVTSVNGQAGDVVLQADDINRADNSETIEASLVSLEADVVAAQASIDNHIADPTDAHDASAISYLNTTSGLAATEVQSAIDETNARIDNFQVGSPGDIPETSFSIANNQVAPADVTGLSFPNASVRSFDCLISAEIDAGSDFYEAFKLYGVRRGSDWVMTAESVGDDAGLLFSITAAGQVQYTSTSKPGYVSGLLKFRAIVTSA